MIVKIVSILVRKINNTDLMENGPSRVIVAKAVWISKMALRQTQTARNRSECNILTIPIPTGSSFLPHRHRQLAFSAAKCDRKLPFMHEKNGLQ